MILVELALDAAGREHELDLDRVADDAAAAVREVADLGGLERRLLSQRGPKGSFGQAIMLFLQPRPRWWPRTRPATRCAPR